MRPPRYLHLASSLLLLLTLTATTSATRKVQYGLVAFGTKIQVSVAGQLHDMGPPDLNAPYYFANLDSPDGSFTYHYVVDGVAEPYDRTQDAARGKTYNDFYGRQQTVFKLPTLPHPLGDSWNRSVGLTPLFDDSYIPTVHLFGDVGEINTLWRVMVNKTAKVTMTVITAEYVKRFENVTYKLSAAGRSQNYAKQAYRLKLDKGDDIWGRDEFKLRCGEEDPTQMREKTYMAMMNAMGTPVMQGNHVRLYVNKVPVGIFIINDDADQKSYVRAELHGNPAFALKHKQPTGTVVECNLLPFINPDPDSLYDVRVTQPGNNPASNPKASLAALLASLAAATDDDKLDAFSANTMDLEIVMRMHVMQYLTANWDGAWDGGSNFVLYEDIWFTKKWYFMDQDFDMTSGIATPSTNSTLKATQISYKNYAPGKIRPLIQKIIASDKYGKRFEQIIINTVKHLFNPNVLSAHYKVLHARLAPEIEWDRAQPRHHVGRPDNWVYKDYLAALDGPVKNIPWGLTQWVDERSSSIASEFGFDLDKTPIAAPDPVVTPPPTTVVNALGSPKSGINKDNVPPSTGAAAGSVRCPDLAAMRVLVGVVAAVGIAIAG